MFTAVFGVLLFNRRTNGPQLLGLGVGLLGVVLISLPSLSEGSSQALGVALVLLATLCYGLATNLAAPLQVRYGSRPVMARMLALATLWTLPFGVVSIPGSSVELAPLAAVLVLGIIGTGLAYLLMGALVAASAPPVPPSSPISSRACRWSSASPSETTTSPPSRSSASASSSWAPCSPAARSGDDPRARLADLLRRAGLWPSSCSIRRPRR